MQEPYSCSIDSCVCRQSSAFLLDILGTTLITGPPCIRCSPVCLSVQSLDPLTSIRLEFSCSLANFAWPVLLRLLIRIKSVSGISYCPLRSTLGLGYPCRLPP